MTKQHVHVWDRAHGLECKCGAFRGVTVTVPNWTMLTKRDRKLVREAFDENRFADLKRFFGAKVEING